MEILQIVIGAFQAASTIVSKIVLVANERDTITPDDARKRVAEAFNWAAQGYQRDVDDLLTRIKGDD